MDALGPWLEDHWWDLPAPRDTRQITAALEPALLSSDTDTDELGLKPGWNLETRERYPKMPLDRIRETEPDLVVLPDEPYRFTEDDGPECFPGIPAALVSGRHLSWYGPSLIEAPGLLTGQLRDAKARSAG